MDYVNKYIKVSVFTLSNWLPVTCFCMELFSQYKYINTCTQRHAIWQKYLYNPNNQTAKENRKKNAIHVDFNFVCTGNVMFWKVCIISWHQNQFLNGMFCLKKRWVYWSNYVIRKIIYLKKTKRLKRQQKNEPKEI